MDTSEKNGVPVKLPAGPMINCWELTRAMAKAVLPSLRDATGVDCIKQKIQLLEGTEMLQPYELDDEDREHLKRMLPNLPPLRGAASNDQATMFLKAYQAHPDRQPWEPVPINQNDVTSNGWAIVEIQSRHQALLQQQIDTGELVAVDSDHCRVKQTGYNSYISRANAIQFLADNAFYPVQGKVNTNNLPEPPPTPEDDHAKNFQLASAPSIEEPESEPKISHETIKKKTRTGWDMEKMIHLYSCWHKGGGGGKGEEQKGVEAVMEQYPGMSRRQINQIVATVKKKYLSQAPTPFDLAAAWKPKRSRKA